MASVTAKILLISAIPTASSMRLASGSLTEIDGRPVSAGNDDGAAALRVMCGQRGHSVLLVGESALVMAGDHHLVSRPWQVQPAIRYPSLARRCRKRQRRRETHRLLAHLF